MCVIDWEMVLRFSPLIVVVLAAYFALLQLKKNILSTQRIKRIDDLRNAISEFFAAWDQYHTAHTNLSDRLYKIQQESGLQKLNLLEKEHMNNEKYDELVSQTEFRTHYYNPYLKASGSFIKTYTKLNFCMDRKEYGHRDVVQSLLEIKDKFDESDKNISILSSFKFRSYALKNKDNLDAKFIELMQFENLEIKNILSLSPLKYLVRKISRFKRMK